MDVVSAKSSTTETYMIRLRPGQEIKTCLENLVEKNKLQAAFVMTAVGSVTKATLRFAHDAGSSTNRIHTFEEQMEIVSLVGTLNEEAHLHISLSDKDGKVIGGHVMGDLIVFTTCEVVIGNCAGLRVTRPFDASTGFPELACNKVDE
ncbi:hypothetical protein RvY_17392-1 [Ramazzottius varieornatus]|uniref:PPC domain-containing protein n=1 Tax=Ramazzottius varieornatus TaxID=947166 RepID=A0A1D1W476_RAMVA|nr:hypothetical protein RvY_17392-1 [Ramazzottius varieornatus]